MRSTPAQVAIALSAACGAYPEQRTGQVIFNALSCAPGPANMGGDPFYVEDAELIAALYAYAARKD